MAACVVASDALATPTPLQLSDLSRNGLTAAMVRHAESSAQSFLQYLQAELRPGPSYPTPDMVWGQTERDRVCAPTPSCLPRNLADPLIRIIYLLVKSGSIVGRAGVGASPKGEPSRGRRDSRGGGLNG